MNKVSRAILLIDDQYVFIKRNKKVNNENIIFYATVGGHLEKGETYEEACRREVYEELGINVDIVSLFHEEYNQELDRYEKFFIVKYISGDLGTGKGEELTNRDEEKYGKFEVVKIDRNKIRDYNVLPKSIKEKLI